MASRTLNVAKGSPLHDRLKARVASRVNLGTKEHSKQHDTWRRAEEITLAYVPESELDAARKSKRDAGEPKYTTIQLPYSYALLMSAHTYWTSVFFARSPVHQFSGRHGEGEMQVQALEALIGYQVEVGEMLGPYYIWLYDAGKYGMGVLGHYWDVQTINYGDIFATEDPTTGQPIVYQATRQVEGYRGNRSYNVSPYDFVTDPRRSIGNFQRGEFVCCRCRLGWHEILQRVESGYYIKANIDGLKDHITDKASTEGSSQLARPQFNIELADDVGEDKKHPAGAVFWEVYIELVPSEWGIGPSKVSQKWCFTITEDLELIVGVSPLGLMHGKFPFDVLEPEVEGYGVFNRGIPEIMEPIQNTMDWLINSHFFNVRAALNNQFILDPSKIVAKDAQKGGPGFIWRLRPEAYGTDIRNAFLQVPVQDVTRANLQDLQSMLGIGERTLGINDQIMGALAGTQRKTATEVRTTTGFGVNRLKTTTEFMSATGFSPHSQKLVMTSQQLYTGEQKLRRVGSLVLDAGQAFLDVNQESIAGSFDFVPVDGTLPVDRIAQANLWKEILGSLRMMPPQVAMGYDWARIFGWIATLAGLKNINQFKIQVVPDATLQGQAQAGNVIPMQPRQVPSPVEPGNSASTAAGLSALGGESSADY